jgi:hypothetical protein
MSGCAMEKRWKNCGKHGKTVNNIEFIQDISGESKPFYSRRKHFVLGGVSSVKLY